MYTTTPQGRFQTNSMLCSSCNNENMPIKKCRLNLSKYQINGDFQRIDCKVCNHFVAIKVIDSPIYENNNSIIDINEVHYCTDDKNQPKHYWHEVFFSSLPYMLKNYDYNEPVKTEEEKIIYYILSQIIYPERDSPDENKFESIYDFPDQSDLVMLRWECGVPIGFYTLKLKGSRIQSINEEYAMTTLDTAYVRSEFRNRGIGTEILTNIIQIFGNEDIGFSSPISEGMWKVLEKFLSTCKDSRLKFWEIEHGGNEGNRKLIWFTIMKKKTKKKTGSRNLI